LTSAEQKLCPPKSSSLFAAQSALLFIKMNSIFAATGSPLWARKLGVEMKTVASFMNAEDAHILRIKLADEGIDAVVADDTIPGIMPYYTNAIGGVKVQVPDEELEKAQAILSREQEHLDIRDELICPKCGSSNIAQELNKQRFYLSSFLLTFFIGAPMPIVKQRYHCNNCNHLWK
jgi:hypothetical protein